MRYHGTGVELATLISFRPLSYGRFTVSSQWAHQQSPEPVPEALLWSFLAQLASALRTVHACGLACRCVGPHHVLVTSGSRLRIGGIGVMDVLEHDQVKCVWVCVVVVL